MVLFLIPIVAGAAAYGAATQDESGSFSAGEGDRKIDCYQIWHQITTGEGPQSLADGQSAAGRLKSNYESRITTIDQLTAEMDAAWTGTSGDAAKSGGHPLKVWMQDSKDKLNDSDKYLGEQFNAFTTVHSKVQEVPKEPPESGFLNDITPWETDTDRAIEEYNTKGQANVDAFNAYFKSSGDNGQGMPTYNAISGQVQAVDVNGDGSGDDGDGKDKDGNGGDDNGGGGSSSGGGYTPGNIPGANIPGGGGPGAGGYTPGNIPGAGGPGSGNIPGYNPGDVPGGPGSPGYKPPAWDGGTGAAGYTPGKIPSAGGFGPGGSGGGGFGPGGVGDIPGAEGFGPGGGGGFGPGSGGNIGAGGAGFGPGSQSGSGAGAGAGSGAGRGMGGAAMGGAAAAGAAGARGAGMGGMGMGGMGAGAGRGGKGAEDEDRQSRFLVGDDPNEVFGTDELTAPPVIGE